MGFWFDESRNEEFSRIDDEIRQNERRWINDWRWSILLAVVIMSMIYCGVWVALAG